MINAVTTLYELMEHIAPEKMQGRATSARLRKEFRRIANFTDENLRWAVEVYENGYAVYSADCRHAVIYLKDILANFDGNLPWLLSITMAGEDQIERNIFRGLTVGVPATKDEDDDIERTPVLNVHIPDPETAYIRKETRRELRSAMKKAHADLTDKQGEVYELRYADCCR